MSIHFWGLGIAKQSIKYFCACLCLKILLLGHVRVCRGEKKASETSPIFSKAATRPVFSEGSCVVQPTVHTACYFFLTTVHFNNSLTRFLPLSIFSTGLLSPSREVSGWAPPVPPSWVHPRSPVCQKGSELYVATHSSNVSKKDRLFQKVIPCSARVCGYFHDIEHKGVYRKM